MARQRIYGYADHFQAASAYMVCGTAEKTAKVCGIPVSTIKDWTVKDWWSDLVGLARKEKNDELDAILTEGIHLGLEGFLERLKVGDPYKTKNDEIKYKPMTGKDCAVSAAVLSDKRTILRGDPTRISKSTTDNKEMDKLQQALNTIGELTEDPAEVVKH